MGIKKTKELGLFVLLSSSAVEPFETWFASHLQLGQDGEDGSIIETLKRDLPPGAIVMDLRVTLEQISNTTEIDVSPILVCCLPIFFGL